MKIVTDPIPLMTKCLHYFSVEEPDDELLMAIHPIIQNICHNYKERVGEEEMNTVLMQLYITTAMRVFDQNDWEGEKKKFK